MPAILSFFLSVLILLLIIALVWAIGRAVIGLLPFDQGTKNVLITVLYIFMLLILLSCLLGFTGWVPGWRLGFHHF
jgi:hypothetical protein